MEKQSQSIFKHQPLRDDGEIRLLSITFSDPEQEPVYRFEHYNLTSAPPYTALSYVWGDLTPQKSTICQPDGELSIAPNLHAFLFTVPKLRYSTNQPLDRLWIDAICINQSDVVERNNQVRQMGAIYHRAKEVLVWLGPASDDSGMAARFIPEMC